MNWFVDYIVAPGIAAAVVFAVCSVIAATDPDDWEMSLTFSADGQKPMRLICKDGAPNDGWEKSRYWITVESTPSELPYYPPSAIMALDWCPANGLLRVPQSLWTKPVHKGNEEIGDGV
jgi:hypothetical protein